MISEWEKHTLLADTALQLDDPVRSILHYQQALSLSEDISECVEIEADERLLISVISCHNLAQFWRWAGDTDYELKYLQLASEKVLTLIPQCPNKECLYLHKIAPEGNCIDKDPKFNPKKLMKVN